MFLPSLILKVPVSAKAMSEKRFVIHDSSVEEYVEGLENKNTQGKSKRDVKRLKKGRARVVSNRPLSRNAETKDFARPTSHPVRGWTGKNKAFCSPGTQNGRRVIKVYYSRGPRQISCRIYSLSHT